MEKLKEYCEIKKRLNQLEEILSHGIESEDRAAVLSGEYDQLEVLCGILAEEIGSEALSKVGG